MKKNLLCLFTVIAAVVLFSSCDDVDPPYTQTVSGPTSSGTTRKILIEDYTGFKCGNCPAAATTIYNTLLPVFGQDLITIGVHASPSNTFTEPSPPASLPPNAPV